MSETSSISRNALAMGAARGCGHLSPYAGQSMTGAQAIVASLISEGVQHIFGYPGGQAIALYDALYSCKEIKHVLCRHEQAAVHAAEGYARAAGVVGVACVTSGPGATNTVTGIANAYLDSIPLVVITCQVPRRVIGTDAFQESDTIGITMPVVKHSYLVQSAAELPKIFREAFHIAITGRPGPVVIDIPSDVAAQSIVFEYPEKVNIPSYKPTYKGNAKQIKAAASLLETAKKPVILAGGGVASSDAAQELLQLAEQMCIPVATTLMGKGAFPSDHQLYLGPVGMHGNRSSNNVLLECDVLLAVGTRLSDRVTGKIEHFAPHAQLIHVDIDPAEIGKLREALVPIVGDAKSVLSSLCEVLSDTQPNTLRSAWVSNLQEQKTEEALLLGDSSETASEAATAEQGDTESSQSDIDPVKALALLSDMLDQHTSIVVTEVGQHQMWAAREIKRSETRSFLSSGGLGTMGFGFPAALGAALACPEKTVVCIAGDGSLQMNIQEMATAIEQGIALKVLVVDNACLGMVHQWQKFFYDKRYSQTQLQCNPDFVLLAQAFGWKSLRVSKQSELKAAFTQMLESDTAFLLDMCISPDCDVQPMVIPGEALSNTVENTNANVADNTASV